MKREGLQLVDPSHESMTLHLDMWMNAKGRDIGRLKFADSIAGATWPSVPDRNGGMTLLHHRRVAIEEGAADVMIAKCRGPGEGDCESRWREQGAFDTELVMTQARGVPVPKTE